MRVADRDFAGEQPRQFEGRADLSGPAVGIAPVAGEIDRQIVLARVGADFDERRDARANFVTGAQQRAVLVVVAVFVARGRAVGERES